MSGPCLLGFRQALSLTCRWLRGAGISPARRAALIEWAEGLSLHSYTGATPAGLVIGCGYLQEIAIERTIRRLAQLERVAKGP